MIERKLLACATMAHPTAQGQQALRRLLSLAPDWDQLINTAIHEGLAGLFYKNLLKAGLLETLADHQQEKLRSCYYSAVRFNLILIRDFTEILKRLNQQGIDVVLLQGIDLLQRIYDDVGLRPVTDIDLWVRESDCPGLTNILSSLGYLKDPLYPLTFRKGATILDIHTHILWAERIKARALLLAKGQDLIIQNTAQIEFENLKIWCLDPYDRIIYLGLHLLKHNASRLIWLVDIKNLVADWKAVDWDALLDRAQLLGQLKCIRYIDFLLDILLDYQAPTDVRQRIQRTKLHIIEKKLLRQRLKKESLPEWSTLILFSSGKGLLKGMMFILETLFPRPDILRQVFAETPGLSFPRLYTRRIFQLIKMARSSWK